MRDWQRFIATRRSGELAPPGPRNTIGVDDRQITYDLKPGDADLGDGRAGERPQTARTNPLAGLPYPNGDTVSRPILSHEQYQCLLEVAPQVHPLFKLALTLANETGHRASGIRLLRWSDISLSDTPFASSVHWRAENDKMGWEHVTPLSVPAVEA